MNKKRQFMKMCVCVHGVSFSIESSCIDEIWSLLRRNIFERNVYTNRLIEDYSLTLVSYDDRRLRLR